MDYRVLEAQQWVNRTYLGRAGYNEIEEDGKTGWQTMYALTRALQIELGISVPSNNFGNGTLSALTAYGNISKDANNSNSNIVKIIQSGLFCKGYDAGAISGTFGEQTANGIKSMQSNMGFQNADGIITPKIFKALLTMDAYVLLQNTELAGKIRMIQQWLNNRYINRQDFFIQPCDGIYSRGTQNALLYAIQYEEGLADGVANGNFGPTTKANLPTLRNGSTDSGTQFVHLLQAALCFYGYNVDFDGIFDADLEKAVKEFQEFCMLTNDGIVGFSTWASLLVSYGNADRTATACDTSKILTSSDIQLLKNKGYQIVGRYLAHNSKGMTNEELNRILSAGLKVFPIYQADGRSVDSFTLTKARVHAHNAVLLAMSRGIPKNTVIYFAVDYDATDNEITNYIIPYLREVQRIVYDANFKIGVYGSRNVCSRAQTELNAISSFVSDMSSGFSGNMGFRLPDNWNYDQIKNTTISDAELGSLEIDVDIYRDQTEPVTNLFLYDNMDILYAQLKALYDCAYYDFANQDLLRANRMVLQFIRYGSYSSSSFNYIAGDTSQNMDYINHIQTNFQSIIPANMSFRNYYGGEVDEGVLVNLRHWALTAEAQLNITGVVVECREYAGWAGDLVQLAAKIQQVYDDPNNAKYHYNFTEDDFYQLIGCKSDAIAQSFGIETKELTGFSLEDLYQDLDAVNISTRLNDVPISYAFYEYYMNNADYITNKYTNRACNFYENLNKSGYEGSTTYLTLYNIASIYTNKPPIFAEIFASMFGDFDETLWGNKLAIAFARRINDWITREIALNNMGL